MKPISREEVATSTHTSLARHVLIVRQSYMGRRTRCGGTGSRQESRSAEVCNFVFPLLTDDSRLHIIVDPPILYTTKPITTKPLQINISGILRRSPSTGALRPTMAPSQKLFSVCQWEIKKDSSKRFLGVCFDQCERDGVWPRQPRAGRRHRLRKGRQILRQVVLYMPVFGPGLLPSSSIYS
jgi:hypothetical protein